MRKTVRNVAVVTALAVAVLVIMGSCQLGDADDTKPAKREVSNEPEIISIDIEYNEESKQWEIPTETVERGQRFRFNAGQRTVWVLFPGEFDYISGEGIFCQTREMLAVTIKDGGSALIEVPRSFPNSDVKQTVRYSVMFRDSGADGWGAWEYAHGPNTPPGMIIPPGSRH